MLCSELSRRQASACAACIRALCHTAHVRAGGISRIRTWAASAACWSAVAAAAAAAFCCRSSTPRVPSRRSSAAQSPALRSVWRARSSAAGPAAGPPLMSDAYMVTYGVPCATASGTARLTAAPCLPATRPRCGVDLAAAPPSLRCVPAGRGPANAPKAPPLLGAMGGAFASRSVLLNLAGANCALTWRGRVPPTRSGSAGAAAGAA
jgi:hypothetical protein